MTDGFTLRLQRVPPTLMLDLLASLDALQREVQVTALDEDGPSAVGQAAHDVLVEGRGRVEEARNAISDQAVAARDAGLAHVDLVAHYATDAIGPFLAARVGVAAADAAAERGELLASPMTPAERRLWVWVGDQFEAQAAGIPGTPYDTDERD